VLSVLFGDLRSGAADRWGTGPWPAGEGSAHPRIGCAPDTLHRGVFCHRGHNHHTRHHSRGAGMAGRVLTEAASHIAPDAQNCPQSVDNGQDDATYRSGADGLRRAPVRSRAIRGVGRAYRQGGSLVVAAVATC